MIGNINNRKKLRIILFVVVALLVLGIGYAGITAVDLIVNGHGLVEATQANFIVHFINTDTAPMILEGMGDTFIDEQYDTIAHLNVIGLSKKGDKAVAKYRVRNDSKGIGANITLNLENTNTEYFKVTYELQDSQLQVGDETDAIVTIELVKTPIEEEESTCVVASLVANPIENDAATGNDGMSKIVLTDFERDSWATIQANVQSGNTSGYHLGDTKTVTINGSDYRVRISNMDNDDSSDVGTNIASALSTDKCDEPGFSETACGFVVEFIDVLDIKRMVDDSGNYGYRYSEALQYLNELYNELPEDLKNVIADTRVVAGSQKNATSNYVLNNQKLFLLSANEIYGDNIKYQNGAKDKTRQLGYYRKNGTEKNIEQICHCHSCSEVEIISQVGSKKYNSNGSSVNYLTRDMNKGDSYGVITISNFGEVESSYAAYYYSVAPSFRIK